MKKQRKSNGPSILKGVLTAATLQLIDTSSSPALDADLIVSVVLKKPKAWLYANPNTAILPAQLKSIEGMLRRREQGEPLEYILGTADFYDLTLQVNSSVLIPRPETEMLVDCAIKKVRDLKKSKTKNIVLLDIGTGSGCIILALANNLRKIKGVSYVGSDMSFRALRVATQNIRNYSMNGRIKLVKSNLLGRAVQSAIPPENPFLIITANLPYIAPDQYLHLPRSVRSFEPRRALIAEDCGTQLIKKLITSTNRWGIEKKYRFEMLMEIDPRQSQMLVAYLKSKFSALWFEFQKDLSGKKRLLIVGNQVTESNKSSKRMFS